MIPHKKKLSRIGATTRALACAVMAFTNLVASSQAAPDLPFDSGSTGADGPFLPSIGPSARAGQVMVYDEVRQQIILFGGVDNELRPLADTWAWDGSSWTLLTPPHSPPAGDGYRGTYDAARSQIVLFHGPRQETWVFNADDWILKTPVNKPDAAGNPDRPFAMAYYPETQKVTLIQTFDRSKHVESENVPSSLGPGYPDITYAAYEYYYSGVKLWEWDGANWTFQNLLNGLFTDSNPYTASRRGRSGMKSLLLSYDPAAHALVMVRSNYKGNNGQFAAIGGVVVADFNVCQQTAMPGETWLWNGVDWAPVTPAHPLPGVELGSALFYDYDRRETVLFQGGKLRDVLIWNNSDWTVRTSVNLPPFDVSLGVIACHGLDFLSPDGLSDDDRATQVIWGLSGEVAFDRNHKNTLFFGGLVQVPTTTINQYRMAASSWLWVGTTWRNSQPAGGVFTLDMSSRPSGIWNFTTINVPQNVTIKFKNNAANTPVRWLATDQVVIDGTIDLGGANGGPQSTMVSVPNGGPGGFAGGHGGIAGRFTTTGLAGQGPGGGAGGTPTFLPRKGEYAPNIGSIYLEPLVGGSGGGGADSGGPNGAGGGGAILIASSRDIVISGKISANGGVVPGLPSLSAVGSGGSILLRADRILGQGVLEAYGGVASNPNGRIRIEAYINSFLGTTTGATTSDLLGGATPPDKTPTLIITTVAEKTVAQPPSGNQLTPDVVFSQTLPVTVVVTAQNVPDGSPVKLRITTEAGVTELGPITLSGGSARFQNVTIPAGAGTVQASAQFAPPVP